jgi:hypothetical protein
MVMGRKEVAVDFITRLKDKGFKDLDKSTKKSIKSLQKLGRTLGVALTATAVVAFVKKSTQQFAELERSTRKLESELNTLGLAFATSLATDFTRSLALATGTSQDKLIPSLQKLVQTTYTLTDAQKLLGLAVEISGRKGLELEQVTNALSRAFVGDFNALVKLRIGFEKAELEGKNFQDVLAALQSEFGVKQADTFAEKIDKLKVAFEETQVAIGRGLIKGLEDSGLSIEQTQQKMIELGEKIGEALGKAAAAVLTLENKLEALASNPVIRFLLDALDALVGLDPFGPAARAAEKETDARVRAANAYTKQLESQGKLVRLAEREAVLAKQRAADVARLKREELKRAQEKKRSADLEKLRNSIQFKFDIDAINLQAALRRQLSQTDRDRVLQLSALKIADYQTDEEAIKTLQAATQGRYDEAMNLEKVLQLLKTAGFANDKASIDALAALKPDIKFTDNLDDIIAKLKAIIEGKYSISIGATITVPNVPGAGGTATATPSGGNFQPGAVISPGTGAPGTGTGTSITSFPSTPGTGSSAIIDTITEIIANQNTLTANFLAGLPSGLDANALATARYELQARTITAENQLTNYLSGARYQAMANEITAQNTLTNQLAADRYTAMQNYYTRGSEPVVVNVNVQGSVVAQNDLVAAVTDAVYATQRSGNSLLIAE